MPALPGGSPGPHANIPAPWRLIIIIAGLLAIITLGFLIRLALKTFNDAQGEGIEKWSIEWSQKQ